MNRLIILIFLLGLNLILIAQKNAEYSISFNIENGNGLKDTIILKLDSMANPIGYWIDNDFGEQDISDKPWNKDFEARFGDAKSWMSLTPKAQSKIRVLRGTCNQLSKYSAGLNINYIYIKSNAYPLKISWDTNNFNSNCLINAYFQRKPFAFDISQEKEHIYLNKLNGVFIMTKSYLDSSDIFKNLDYIDVDGNFIHTLVFVSNYKYKDIIATSDLSESTISIYPNPVSDKLSIDFSAMPFEKCTLSIIDMTGKRYQSIEIPYNSKHDIDVATLPKGMYILELINDRQERICKKFVKMSD